MSSSASSPSHLCVVCGLGAKSFCKACKDAPKPGLNTTSTVWYCGPECQKKDWSKHKPICKEAQALKQASVAAAVVPKPNQHYCAHCGREASLNCKACQGAPKSTDLNEKVTVWYCGKDCQKKEWENHKPICEQARDRAEVCRIARLLQALLYVFNRVTYMWPLDRIDKTGSLWVLRPPSNNPNKSVIVPFPPSCVTTAEEEKIILSYSSCSSALSDLHNLTALWLKPKLPLWSCSPKPAENPAEPCLDYCSDIAEIKFRVKNQQLRLLRVLENGQIDTTDYSHLVLKITLSNGEQYAVDMTGAQYGWTETILPWDFYLGSRVRLVEEVMAFGHTKTNLREYCLYMGGKRGWTNKIYEDFGKALDDVVAQIEADGILPKISALVRLSEVEFEAQQEELLYTIGHHLERVKAVYEEYGSLTNY